MIKNNLLSIEELKIVNEGMSNLLSSMYSELLESNYDFKHKLGEVASLSKSTFFNIIDSLDTTQITKLDSKQIKFSKIVEQMGYINIRELKAYVPEGMCVKYLELIKSIKKAVSYLITIDKDRLIPYELLLANLISSKDILLSLNTNESVYLNMQKNREDLLSDLNNCYNSKSTESITNIKYVVDKNNDWKEILSELNMLLSLMINVDRKELQNKIIKINTYLDILINMSKDKEVSVTPEIIRYLSNGSYQIAKELEFFSSTYFRLLQLKGSIEHTMENVLDIYK